MQPKYKILFNDMGEVVVLLEQGQTFKNAFLKIFRQHG